MARRRKPKPLSAVKEVKRQARRLVGTPPATRRHETPKDTSPKHKKREWEKILESL